MPEWSCTGCGTANDAAMPRCTVCGNHAPGPADLRAAPPFAPAPESSAGPMPAPRIAPMSAPLIPPAPEFPGGTGRPRRSASAAPWAAIGGGLVIVIVLAGAGYLLLDPTTAPMAATPPIAVTGVPDVATGGTGTGTGGVAPTTGGPAGVTETPDSGAFGLPEVPPDDSGPAASPSAAPGRVGMVSIATDAAADPRAPAIAALFDAYFTAINAHDARAAAGAFAPGGVVDPGDPGQVADFGRDIATTRDSDVRLRSVADDAHTGEVIATVSFTSSQAPGYGPPERRDETCTDWHLDFRLRSWEGELLIFGTAPGAVSAPCR